MNPEKIFPIWNKLDEVMGAGMLTTMGLISMFLGYNSSVTQMCVTGVVALLAVKIAKPERGEK